VPVTELTFTVLDVVPEPYGAAPTLLFRVRLAESTGAVVHAVALRAQIQIEPQRRGYTGSEGDGLADLFGPPDRWSSTVRPILWTHAGTMVRGFTGDVEFDLPVLCTYDFEVAAAKYLHALRDGTIPLQFLFSGTVFGRGSSDFAVQQVPWDREERYDMPVSVWRDLIRQHFPNTGWVRLDRDTIDALAAYRSARGLLGFDDAITSLLAANSATREVS
jgi:hypothetical protein